MLQSTGNTQNNYLYRGEQIDSNLGMQYLRARYYNQNQGRFASVDPFEGILEQPITRHRYIYGNDNPITYTDPSGAFSIAEPGISFSIAEVLATIGSIVYVSQALFALGSRRDINWDGKLIAETKSPIDHSIPQLKFDGAVLEATSESTINSSGAVTQFQGYWLILTAGTSLIPDKASISPKIEIKPEQSVKLFSPSEVGTNLATFFGQFTYGKVKFPQFSGGGFTIGFGKGYFGGFNETNTYASVTGFAGISIPITGQTYPGGTAPKKPKQGAS